MLVQINGTKKSQATRKATRYFSERGIEFHLRDVLEKHISQGEIDNIRRSVDPEELIDTGSDYYKKRGFAHMVYDPIEEILENPRILNLPIVRNGKDSTVGYAPEIWDRWIAESK